MLTEALRKDIDSRWESCWPVNTLRPLVIIDGISYLLFFKKLEDHKLITRRSDLSNNDKASYLNDSAEICWNNLKGLDSKNIYNLFTKENGIADLLKNYGHTNLPYSNFLKSPMLVNPSAVLLANVIEIIKIIESQDAVTKGNIFEYLLHKQDIHSARGQVYLPEDIINAIISIMRPEYNEEIYDPACGNGDFLVSATLYISNKYVTKKSGVFSKKIIGLDNDPIQMRIAAMNMILHGIENPLLIASDTFTGKADLIISNLFFDNLENNPADASSSPKENERKDISVLKNVLKNLNENGRAAVLIKNYLLNNNLLPELKTIRQQIVDHYKIDAVIHLPETGPIPGASVLIFHLQANEINDKIWFYKIKKTANMNGGEAVHASDNTNGKNINANAAWHTVETKPATDSYKYIKLPVSESFCISVEEIRNSNYNLLYNQHTKNIAVSASILTNGIPETKEKPVSEILIKTKNIFGIIKRFDVIKAFVISRKLEMLKRLEVLKGINVSKKIDMFRRIDVYKRINAFSKMNVSRKFDAIKRFDIRNKLNAIDSTDKFITAIAIPALILVFCITSLFFTNRSKVHSKRLQAKTFKPVTTNKLKHSANLFSDKREKKKLTPQQIKAIIKDTSGIIHFENFSANNHDSINEELLADAAEKNNYSRSHKSEKQISLNEPGRGIIKTKYTVTDTTYFHDKPADGSARKSYLDPLKKNILTSLQETNGFIYIVYTNKYGRTSKGWIRKRDLRQLPE
jgi:type I restriction enzyme M protein